MQPYNGSISLIEAGVDWVTVRALPGEGAENLQRHGYDLTYDAIHRGGRPSAWTFYGYSGVTVDDVSWGVCDRGCIVQVRGAGASLAWATLVRLADRVNRLDVMATVVLRPPNPMVVEELIDAYAKAPNLNHRKAKASWVHDSDGGGTFYLGRRKSDHFARVYNKEKESPRIFAYTGAWRYECELSGATAAQVASHLAASPDSRRECVGYIRTYFTDRGLPCLLPSGEDVRVPISHIREASDQRALDWLSHSIQPTVRRLLYNGRADSVLDALGLSDWPGISVEVDHPAPGGG